MPKDLTDVSQWDTVAVPVGTDPATASSVETPIQLLTDRSRFLLDRISRMIPANFRPMNNSFSADVVPHWADGRIIACHDQKWGTHLLVVSESIAAPSLKVLHSDGNGTWRNKETIGGVNGAAVAEDGDDDHAGRVTIVCSTGPNFIKDAVYTSLDGAAFSLVTITGTPGLNFQRIGCDKAASPTWIIGDKVSSGSPSLYSSTNGTTYSVVSGFPTVTSAQDILDIQHTCHHAGALGPSDPGNARWLVITPDYAFRSTDGATWFYQSHGLSIAIASHRKIAYSRTSQRWVAVTSVAGQVAYSDDHGATWTTIAGALGTSIGERIVSDGHGTFVVQAGDGDRTTSYARAIYISVDEGLTWTRHYVSHIGTIPYGTLRDLMSFGLYDMDETPDSVQGYLFADYDSGTEEHKQWISHG
ncbi:MAG: exo-alpha-sialidase [Propionibacteriaceae bacterium]|nr:exo-alpha-sialidase [Propionibacteriaceae bacterium]